MSTERYLYELSRIAAALEGIQQALLTFGQADEGCAHPPDMRQDMSSMTEVCWRCTVCGFTFGPQERTHASV